MTAFMRLVIPAAGQTITLLPELPDCVRFGPSQKLGLHQDCGGILGLDPVSEKLDRISCWECKVHVVVPRTCSLGELRRSLG